jgi:hypothetical protein
MGALSPRCQYRHTGWGSTLAEAFEQAALALIAVVTRCRRPTRPYKASLGLAVTLLLLLCRFGGFVDRVLELVAVRFRGITFLPLSGPVAIASAVVVLFRLEFGHVVSPSFELLKAIDRSNINLAIDQGRHAGLSGCLLLGRWAWRFQIIRFS